MTTSTLLPTKRTKLLPAPCRSSGSHWDVGRIPVASPPPCQRWRSSQAALASLQHHDHQMFLWWIANEKKFNKGYTRRYNTVATLSTLPSKILTHLKTNVPSHPLPNNCWGSKIILPTPTVPSSLSSATAVTLPAAPPPVDPLDHCCRDDTSWLSLA